MGTSIGLPVSGSKISFGRPALRASFRTRHATAFGGTVNGSPLASLASGYGFALVALSLAFAAVSVVAFSSVSIIFARSSFADIERHRREIRVHLCGHG